MTKRFNSSETGNLCVQQLQIGPLYVSHMGAGRRLDIHSNVICRLIMSTTLGWYATHTDPMAEQNPAYIFICNMHHMVHVFLQKNTHISVGVLKRYLFCFALFWCWLIRNRCICIFLHNNFTTQTTLLWCGRRLG